jgi:hypothetical protein
VVAGIGPWREIEEPDDEDLERKLLDLADRGLVPAALEGFRSLADADVRALRDLNDTDVVDAYFDGAPRDDIQWHNREANRYWAADLRDALRPTTAMPATTSRGEVSGTSSGGRVGDGWRTGDDVTTMLVTAGFGVM